MHKGQKCTQITKDKISQSVKLAMANPIIREKMFLAGLTRRGEINMDEGEKTYKRNKKNNKPKDKISYGESCFTKNVVFIKKGKAITQKREKTSRDYERKKSSLERRYNTDKTQNKNLF